MSATQTAHNEAVFNARLEKVMVAVDLHHCILHDYLYRLTRHWQDAEDILQDLWRYVLLHFPEDKIDSLSLLRRKAYQLFVDHYRAAKRRPELVEGELPEMPTTGQLQPAVTDAGEAQMKSRFWGEFHGIELTDQQKDVLWLHGRYGQTYQEIAQATGIAPSTVGDWITLGRERLADYLNQQTN